MLLLDEPCSALDPISTAKVEELIHELKTDYTVVIVTHNMQQAARVSDYTAYMYLGELIEYDVTDTIFIKPKNARRPRTTSPAGSARPAAPRGPAPVFRMAEGAVRPCFYCKIRCFSRARGCGTAWWPGTGR